MRYVILFGSARERRLFFAASRLLRAFPELRESIELVTHA